ncbi:MAG: GNAT family N-acetyltransferase [Bdellovibrionales bacterium]|nr:GNAT family N-acetyltransferase [Bdellovibrionales bacterium]
MNWQEFTPEAGLEKVETYLRKNRPECCLLLSLLENPTVLERIRSESRLFALSDGQQKVIWAVLQQDRHNVIPGIPDGPIPDADLDGLAELLKSVSVPGIVGRPSEVNPLAQRIARLKNQTVKTAMTQRVLSTRQVDWSKTPGREIVHPKVRLMRESDREIVTRFVEGFANEALADSPADQNRITGQIPSLLTGSGRYFLLEDSRGEPAAIAAYSGVGKDHVRVGLVYTPPEKRGQGFAGQIVAEISQRALDQGMAFVSLFTDATNPMSNRAYERVGFRLVCDSVHLRFAQP